MEVTPDIDLESISFMCKIKNIPQNERVPLFLVIRIFKQIHETMVLITKTLAR